MQEQDKTQTQGKQETHKTWMLFIFLHCYSKDII